MKRHRKHLFAMRCPVTGKLGYVDRSDAREARRRSRLLKGEKTSEWSVYRCRHCDYWHIGHNHRVKKHRPSYADDEALVDSIVQEDEEGDNHELP